MPRTAHQGRTLPIIMLTAKGEEMDEVLGLETYGNVNYGNGYTGT